MNKRVRPRGRPLVEGDFVKVNVDLAVRQADWLGSYADDLEGMKKDIETFKTQLNEGWEAEEMSHVNAAIERIISDISKVTTKLDSLQTDIVSAAHDIRREEEERERQLKEELARKAAEIKQNLLGD
jgi:septal ring factor EnvC (AmiA/AmiB activator)